MYNVHTRLIKQILYNMLQIIERIYLLYEIVYNRTYYFINKANLFVLYKIIRLN